MYKNGEGYADPTAGAALGNIMRENRMAEKQKRAYLPKVYICSPLAGDMEKNIEKARHYCAFAAAQGYIPFAAHLFFPQFLSDRDKEQRALGMFMGMVYLDGCRECWVFGSTVSSGMDTEIERARKRGLILRYFTEACEEVTR